MKESDWSISNNIQVINMSIGTTASQSLHDSILKAYASNIVIVASAVNDSSSSVKYPAAYK
ncbi:MAG: S8 family serine peptidase [Clostridiaceae bacterium]